jgi:hypothetical protein
MVAAVLVPFLGLAMDGAMLCVIKERLNTAVDSAANSARFYPPKSPKGEAVVRRFLDANFPEGHMGTGARTVIIDDSKIEVHVSAPTYFLKLIHVQNVEVTASHKIGA